MIKQHFIVKTPNSKININISKKLILKMKVHNYKLIYIFFE